MQYVLEIIQGNQLKLDQLIHNVYNLLAEYSRAKLFISSYKRSFCKDVIRQFVRDNTYKRISIPGSPYIVKMEIAEKHKIKLIEKYVPKKLRFKTFANETPEQLMRRKESERVNQTLFTINVRDLISILTAIHTCSHQSESINTPALTITENFSISNQCPDLIIRCSDCGCKHSLSGVKRAELFEYPKPDEQLTLWERATESLKPMGTKDPIFSCCFGDLLFAWNFINTMNEFIQLSTFTFRDFEEALLWESEFPDESPSVLLLETLLALIRCLLRNSTGKLIAIVRHAFGGYKAVRKRNWELSVRTYVKACIQFVRDLRGREGEVAIPFEVPSVLELYVSDKATLEESCYRKLEVSTKAKLLMFLCDHIGMSQNFKTFVDRFATDLHDTRSKVWEERNKLVEENKNGTVNENGSGLENPLKKMEIINERTDELDRNIKRLNTKARTIQLKLKSFSIEPLGKDRDYNTYWYIPPIGYRIFIETNTEWIYLDTKMEVDQLIGYLNEKGERECVLKERLVKLREDILTSIEGYFELLLLSTEIRRSTRMAAMVKHKQSFMAYVNSYLKET